MHTSLSKPLILVSIMILLNGAAPMAAQDSLSVERLKPLGRYPWSESLGVNHSGVVIGSSTSENGCVERGVIWRDSRQPQRMTVPAGDKWARPRAINDKGIVVGGSLATPVCLPEDTPPGPPCLQWQPIVWGADGEPRSLPNLAGLDTALPRDINAAGEIVGTTYDLVPASYDPFNCPGIPTFWDVTGTPSALKTLPGRGYPEGYALAVRVGSSGPLAAGFVRGLAGQRGVVWSPAGRARPRRPLPGHTDSNVLGLNSNGVAVGVSWSEQDFEEPWRAVKWAPGGKPRELLPPQGAAGEWCRANAISEAGFSVGSCSGFDDFEFHETPVVWERDGTAHVLPVPDWKVDAFGGEWSVGGACWATDIATDSAIISGNCLGPGFPVGLVWK